MALHTPAFRAIELFAGIGMLGEGLRAGLNYLGIPYRTQCYVEREGYPASILAARGQEGSLDNAPIWSDVLTFDGEPFRDHVDAVIGGFPCQDLSLAGRRAGLDGQRSGLFFRLLDIADACGSRWLFLENVAGIVSSTASVVDEAGAAEHAADAAAHGSSAVGGEDGRLLERAVARVMGELAARGWDAEILPLSASDVGASHGRARWFCLAWRRSMDDAQRVKRIGERVHQGPGAGCAPLADTGCSDARRREHVTGAGGVPAEHSVGSEELAYAELRSRGEQQPGCARVWGAESPRGGAAAMADTGQPGLPDTEPREPGEPGRWDQGRAAAELCGTPLFAPGPQHPAWRDILAARPELAPALEPDFRELVDGLAFDMDDSRAPRLKCAGNGVIPLQAAAAAVVLFRRAAGVMA